MHLFAIFIPELTVHGRNDFKNFVKRTNKPLHAAHPDKKKKKQLHLKYDRVLVDVLCMFVCVSAIMYVTMQLNFIKCQRCGTNTTNGRLNKIRKKKCRK